MFVTSTTYSGALGSAQAADAHCQSSAAAHGLAGTFHAWVSDANTNAYDRLADVGPWYTTAGEVAFANKSNLRGGPDSELLDELGGHPESANGAWTGTDATGATTGEDCEGWTNATADATATTGTLWDSSWGAGGSPLRCNEKAPLICFEQ